MTPRTQMTRDGNQRWEKEEETLGGKIKWIPSHSNIEEQMAVIGETKNAKLNPRWVETLMGLPVGWVMPSCVNPITPIAESVMSVGGNWPTASTMDVITPTRNLLSMESKGHWGKKPRSRPDGIGFTAPNTGKLSEMVNYTQTSTPPVTIEPTNSDYSETESCQQPQHSHGELFGEN